MCFTYTVSVYSMSKHYYVKTTVNKAILSMSCLTSMNPPLHFSTHIIQVIEIHAVGFLNTHFIQKDFFLFNTKILKAI